MGTSRQIVIIDSKPVIFFKEMIAKQKEELPHDLWEIRCGMKKQRYKNLFGLLS